MRSGSDLRGCDLDRQTLTKRDLSGSDLRGACLQGADLREAILDGADLGGACLRDALLMETPLRGVTLKDATLCGANPSRAALSGARVLASQLECALICSTTMPDGSLGDDDLGTSRACKACDDACAKDEACCQNICVTTDADTIHCARRGNECPRRPPTARSRADKLPIRKGGSCMIASTPAMPGGKIATAISKRAAKFSREATTTTAAAAEPDALPAWCAATAPAFRLVRIAAACAPPSPAPD